MNTGWQAEQEILWQNVRFVNDKYEYIKIFLKLKKIIDCRLEVVDVLPFDFFKGGCKTFSFRSKEEAWLCFGESDSKKCDS